MVIRFMLIPAKPIIASVALNAIGRPRAVSIAVFEFRKKSSTAKTKIIPMIPFCFNTPRRRFT